MKSVSATAMANSATTLRRISQIGAAASSCCVRVTVVVIPVVWAISGAGMWGGLLSRCVLGQGFVAMSWRCSPINRLVGVRRAR